MIMINFLFFCQREVRELCDDRVHFYQSLQESELKTGHSAAKQWGLQWITGFEKSSTNLLLQYFKPFFGINCFFLLSVSVWPVNRGLPCFSTGWVLWRLVCFLLFGTCVWTVFHFHFEWPCCFLSLHQNVLGGYPPNHVLSALQYLASREQKELEDKLASLDVTQDVTALR